MAEDRDKKEGVLHSAKGLEALEGLFHDAVSGDYEEAGSFEDNIGATAEQVHRMHDSGPKPASLRAIGTINFQDDTAETVAPVNKKKRKRRKSQPEEVRGTAEETEIEAQPPAALRDTTYPLAVRDTANLATTRPNWIPGKENAFPVIPKNESQALANISTEGISSMGHISQDITSLRNPNSTGSTAGLGGVLLWLQKINDTLDDISEKLDALTGKDGKTPSPLAPGGKKDKDEKEDGPNWLGKAAEATSALVAAVAALAAIAGPGVTGALGAVGDAAQRSGKAKLQENKRTRQQDEVEEDPEGKLKFKDKLNLAASDEEAKFRVRGGKFSSTGALFSLGIDNTLEGTAALNAYRQGDKDTGNTILARLASNDTTAAFDWKGSPLTGLIGSTASTFAGYENDLQYAKRHPDKDPKKEQQIENDIAKRYGITEAENAGIAGLKYAALKGSTAAIGIGEAANPIGLLTGLETIGEVGQQNRLSKTFGGNQQRVEEAKFLEENIHGGIGLGGDHGNEFIRNLPEFKKFAEQRDKALKGHKMPGVIYQKFGAEAQGSFIDSLAKNPKELDSIFKEVQTLQKNHASPMEQIKAAAMANAGGGNAGGKSTTVNVTINNTHPNYQNYATQQQIQAAMKEQIISISKQLFNEESYSTGANFGNTFDRVGATMFTPASTP